MPILLSSTVLHPSPVLTNPLFALTLAKTCRELSLYRHQQSEVGKIGTRFREAVACESRRPVHHDLDLLDAFERRKDPASCRQIDNPAIGIMQCLNNRQQLVDQEGIALILRQCDRLDEDVKLAREGRYSRIRRGGRTCSRNARCREEGAYLIEAVGAIVRQKLLCQRSTVTSNLTA